MTGPIDAAERFRFAGLRAKFARLSGLAEEHRKAVERDPLPYLVDMANENARLKLAIEEAIHALQGMAVIAPRPEHGPIPPPDIRTDLFNRIRAGEEILKSALASK
jgi:hypothetical protein